MSNWQITYADRVMSAPDAIGKIRPRSRIFLGSGGAEPRYLLSEFIREGSIPDRFGEMEIIHLLSLGCAPQQAEFPRHVRYNSFFVGDGVRDAVCEGIADYTPIFICQQDITLLETLI